MSTDNFENKFSKLEKQVEETFVDTVKSTKSEDLNDLVVTLVKQQEEVLQKKEDDATLKALKEDLKDLNAGYGDVLKELKKRVKYVIMTLESRGK